MTTAAISVLDLDETLIRGQSGAIWISHLVARKLAPPSLLGRVALVDVLWRRGINLDVDRLARDVTEGFRGLPVAGMDVALDDFVGRRIVPTIRPEARGVVDELRALGHRVLLASASIAPIVERVAAVLNVDGWLATRIEPAIDGRFSGRLKGPLLTGRAKLRALVEFADHHWRDWRLARAYSHYESDLDLFEAAAEPIPVNPSTRLRAIAAARGWQPADWR